MSHRPILRTAKCENLGDKIGRLQRLQWPTYVEGAIPEDERVHYSHPLNQRGGAREMSPDAYLWLLPDQYGYKPLENDFRAIRLLEVLPGPANSIIKCTMRHGRLDAHYTCLSYMSSFNDESDARKECFISVDKKRLEVSRNLWSFLQFARAHHMSNLFWIDEICINSQDPTEKDQQVSLIPWIYRSATATIAWLENSAESTGSPDLSVLEYAADIAHEHVALDPVWLTSQTTAIQTLLFHPYWWRVWTAQELLLSRIVFFLTSTSSCGLDTMQALFRGLNNVKRWFPDLHHSLLCSPAFNILNNIRKLFIRNHGLPLHYLMQALKFHDCAEPRDRIYGVLGLALHGDVFDIDYREPLSDLLRRSWEAFAPRMTRSMAKLLFADLVEALDVDVAALPFQLVSARATNSQLMWRVAEPFSMSRVKMEIRDKGRWSETGPPDLAHLCVAMACCRPRRRTAAVRRARQKHGVSVCQVDSLCRTVSCCRV